MNARLKRNALLQPGAIVTDGVNPGAYLYLILSRETVPGSDLMYLMVIYDDCGTNMVGFVCRYIDTFFGTIQLFNER